jgi:hypothetical protein
MNYLYLMIFTYVCVFNLVNINIKSFKIGICLHTLTVRHAITLGLAGKTGDHSDRITRIAEKLSLINLANTAYGANRPNKTENICNLCCDLEYRVR